MSATYASASRDETAAGRIILMVSSSLAAVLVIAGLIYAAGTGARHEAALAAAGCEPGLSPSGLQCTTQAMLTSQYMAIEIPASQQLNADMAAYTATERRHLAAAEAALSAEATTQTTFDASLAAIKFPPAITPVARTLILAGQARVALLDEQAKASSLTRLRSFNHRAQAASATVQKDMELVRAAIATRPQET